MKILVIGGVAAGTKAAAKWKRENRADQVVLLTKSADISYAGCGLPYYVGGSIENREELIVNTPRKYRGLTGVEVLTLREATHVDPAAKVVTAHNLENGQEETYGYDKLIVATGASAVKLPLPGVDLNGVFPMRAPEDAITMRDYLEANGVKKAVVIGGGFIGLELAENLFDRGISVTVVEVASQILSGVLDGEMAGYVQHHLQQKGIRVLTGTKATALVGDGKVEGVQTDAGLLPCGAVVVSAGIRPNTAFLEGTGIQMEKGAIVVDECLATSVADIYAAGDCALVKNRLTGKAQYSPMGSSANLEGRTLAQNLNGENKTYPGVLGTGVVKLPGLNVGRTGLTESAAKEAGYDVETVVAVTDDKAHYYPGAAFFITKLLADRNTHQLLGVQVLGPGAVDKMVDIAVVGLSMGLKLEDFENLDLAYAPPFSTAIHPFVQAVYVLENKLSGAMQSMTPAQYAAGAAEGYTVIDVNPQPTIRGAKFVDLSKVEGPIEGIGKDEKLLLVCGRGKRAYFLQNRLKFYGYTNTLVLEGATTFNQVRVAAPGATVPPEEITRVKGLGFLWDKNTPDCFNGRVITRNGKITADEMRAITEAAERFGNGQVAMTTRLTIEIQHIPFDNIEPLREFLAQHGLETGGTGSKVRPVVSCKGTTCQYGLIDTFALSEEIHERFYHGYNDVKLPHKFKIAVGGCPNNCVKPDLNDLGIIGQKVPRIDLDKCRGCKVCQVEKACPIQVPVVQDGKVVIDDSACNHCGRCVGKCPFKAVEGFTSGYRVYIGGRWGKKVAHGRYLEKVFTDKDEVLNIVEKAILLFREQGLTGERFADTVERIGFENVQEQLLSDGLLQRKEENLKLNVKGGAEASPAKRTTNKERTGRPVLFSLRFPQHPPARLQDGPVESCIAIGYNKEVKNGNERFDERRRPMEKYVRDSYTEHVQILSQSSLNGYKRLFGGRLMEWIDVVAGVVARRHSNRNVTTAAVDNLRFEGPAYGNETIVLCGYITYTGRTSMEVCVRTYVEELNGHKRLINVAYLVMVALDENERPVEVPRLVLATEEERREWEAAVERTRLRKERRRLEKEAGIY